MEFRKTVKSLFRAIKTNDSENVREILLKNPKLLGHPDCKDKKQASALWDAMLEGHEDVVELLVREFGADPDEQCPIKDVFFTGYTFLQYTASCRYSLRKSKVAEVLIRLGADVNSFEIYKAGTPLQLALESGNVQGVEFFLQNGGRLEGPEWFESSPGYLVFESHEDDSQCKELLLLLIKHGLDTKFRNKFGDNLLHLFCKLRTYRENLTFPFVNKDTLKIVEILLDSGVPVDELDEDGRPLISHAVVDREDLELTSLLIQRGANVNNVVVFEYNLLFFVTTLDCDEKKMCFAELLLSNGVDINAKGKDGWTALHVACVKSCESIISFYIRKGADLSPENAEGETPFFFLYARHKVYGHNKSLFVMVKEFSRLSFEKLPVCRKDMDLINSDLNIQKYFEECEKELFLLKSTVFYAPYSYYSVMKMTRSVKKLANLTKNEEFVTAFENNLPARSCYEADLRWIFNEAIQARNNRLLVEHKLKSMFGNMFPNVVMKKLAENFSIQDLQHWH